ncbi:MAG: hypothetical protein AAGJ97_13105 [Planctomycetota bacterium]
MNQPSAFARVAAAFCVAAVTTGCGGSPDGLKFAPVSGTVTVNGGPAVGVTVLFKPKPTDDSTISGTTSRGFTDENGKYTLRVTSGNPRAVAVVGEHDVLLTGRELYTEEDLEVSLEEGFEVTKITFDDDQKSHSFTVPPGGTSEADFSIDGVEMAP